MLRSVRLSFSLTVAAALALANTPIQPASAQDEGNAADLGYWLSRMVLSHMGSLLRFL